MKWRIEENEPKLAPSGETGARILLDGQELRAVRSFDTDEGWAEVMCTDGHTGHPGRKHLAPDDKGDRPCTVTLHGVVRVEVPA